MNNVNFFLRKKHFKQKWKIFNIQFITKNRLNRYSIYSLLQRISFATVFLVRCFECENYDAKASLPAMINDINLIRKTLFYYKIKI